MPVGPGTKFSQYRITDKLGEGGMGEVWKAVDTSLGREVAVKVLPEVMAADPERVARFEREAKLLATLNHPHIATIHGMHVSGGTRFLAMELLEGDSLAQRLSKGALPLGEALPLALQIAQALEAAHARGVIHRDLKPANLQVTPDSQVKVLDFGLAKMLDPELVADPSASDTLKLDRTDTGVLVGTAAYMSPEQARGEHADRRADIWAFGCVLFEMLAGSKAFPAETPSDTLVAVLTKEPDWDLLPAATPAAIRRLLRRSLVKDAEDRLHDIADARIEITDALEGGPEPGSAAVPPPNRVRWIPALLLFAAVAIALVTWRMVGTPDHTGESLHVSVLLPATLDLEAVDSGLLAVSPDGRQVAIAAREDDTVRLYLRRLDAPGIQVFAGSETAEDPFFSTDGEWVGFFAGGKLQKVSVNGGAPVALADAPSDRGGSWADDGSIIFSPSFTTGLYRVRENGEGLEAITTVDPTRNERTHRWPHVLPGSRAVLFTVGTLDSPSDFSNATIEIVDLDTGERRALIEGASMAQYSSTGHIVYARENGLLAVPFDVEKLVVTGPPTPLLDGVSSDPSSGVVNFGFAHDGTLIYIPVAFETQERTLSWVDRSGRASPAAVVSGVVAHPRVSHGGGSVAMQVIPGRGEGDIWVLDLADQSMARLSFDNTCLGVAWSNDDQRVAFGSVLGRAEGVYWTAADGSASPGLIAALGGQFPTLPDEWIPNTNTLVCSRIGGSGRLDIVAVDVDRGTVTPIVDGPAGEGGASFSPDGRWMAYASDETGRQEIYVRAYPGPGGRWQLSTEGGRGARWSQDGTEIFYSRGTRMMSVPVQVEPTFSAGAPEELFRYPFFRRTFVPCADYDVSPDGEMFLVVDLPERQVPEIHVITNIVARLD